MGKGDRYRKVNQDKFNENFDRIFNKREEKMKTQNKPKLKEYIWHNHCDMTEEVTVYAESYEQALDKFNDGEGETHMIEQTSRWDECVKNPDDFEDNEEDNNECK
jgi:phage terminase small subunit|tara:strand:+ start:520 stop:834 length:315 start_codon:yes stop_codon:yes gene_type:complete